MTEILLSQWLIELRMNLDSAGKDWLYSVLIGITHRTSPMELHACLHWAVLYVGSGRGRPKHRPKVKWAVKLRPKYDLEPIRLAHFTKFFGRALGRLGPITNPSTP